MTQSARAIAPTASLTETSQCLPTQSPIPAIFVGTIIVVMIALEVGYRLGSVVHRAQWTKKESPASVIAGAILALATFMLAFTFGIVADRYDTKECLVREDANAIRTAWHRLTSCRSPIARRPRYCWRATSIRACSSRRRET